MILESSGPLKNCLLGGTMQNAYFNKGPSQKFSEVQQNKEHSFGRERDFTEITLEESSGVLYTYPSES